VVQELLRRFPGSCDGAAGGNAHVAAARHFLDTSADLRRLHAAMGGAISSFDPERASTPRGVFCLVRAEASTP
jgi:hypothetical protein